MEQMQGVYTAPMKELGKMFGPLITVVCQQYSTHSSYGPGLDYTTTIGSIYLTDGTGRWWKEGGGYLNDNYPELAAELEKQYQLQIKYK